MPTANPLEDEELFDSIILGTLVSPGVVTLSGHDSKNKWDVKEGTAQAGATTTLKNVDSPVEFTASFYLADLEEINAWPEFADLINSTTAGAKVKALEIFHPDLSTQGITSVTKASIAGCVHDKKGGQTYAVKFQVYRPAKKKPASSPNGSIAAKKDPNQDVKDEIARLTSQYNNTPWGNSGNTSGQLGPNAPGGGISG